MKFTFEITELDGAAFSDGNMEYEVARIMRKAADAVEGGEDRGVCHDYNGNRVGAYGFAKEDDK